MRRERDDESLFSGQKGREVRDHLLRREGGKGRKGG